MAINYDISDSINVPMREFTGSPRNIPDYKICLLGNSNVGKSMLLRCLCAGGGELSNENLSSTIGMELVKHVVKGPHRCRLQLWDTGGHERFRAITGNYLRNSHVVLFVFDITNAKSYEAIPRWMEMAQGNVDQDTLFMLIGNKLDLFERRVVSQVDANKFALRNRMEYFECSARKGFNILFLFNQIAKDLSYQFKEETKKKFMNSLESSSVDLTNSYQEEDKTKSCTSYC